MTRTFYQKSPKRYIIAIIVLAVFTLISRTTLAQSFTLSELYKMNNMNYEEFETVVTNKGYEYSNMTNSKHETSYNYSYKANYNKATRHINYATFSDGSITVSYQTSYINDYNKLKQSAKIAGYIYKETKEFEGSIYHTFTKDKSTILFFTFKSNNKFGLEKTGYEISVE